MLAWIPPPFFSSGFLSICCAPLTRHFDPLGHLDGVRKEQKASSPAWLLFSTLLPGASSSPALVHLRWSSRDLLNPSNPKHLSPSLPRGSTQGHQEHPSKGVLFLHHLLAHCQPHLWPCPNLLWLTFDAFEDAWRKEVPSHTRHLRIPPRWPLSTSSSLRMGSDDRMGHLKSPPLLPSKIWRRVSFLGIRIYLSVSKETFHGAPQ